MPSLVPHGLESFEEEDLRFYFAQAEPPSDLGAFARWSRIARIMADYWELREKLSSFYRVGILPYAVRSVAILHEYGLLFPDDRAPLGGVALADWVEREKRRVPVLQWTAELCSREGRGTLTGAERLLFDQVRREVAPQLEELVGSYQGSRPAIESMTCPSTSSTGRRSAFLQTPSSW